MASEQFAVSWDNFHKIMSSGINSLLENEDLVDVTLAIEGRYLKAHKMVLSVCSPYFNELFKTSPCKHPIVFMKDVSYVIMSDLLQFMYQGEVQVNQENFNTFIKTAESLQIRGLSNYGNGSAECGPESPIHKNTHHKLSSPSSPKRQKFSENTVPNPIVKNEPHNEFNFKMEPYDSHTEFFSDNPMDDPDDWMIEGGDDESQTGTSGNVVLVGDESIASDMEEASVSSVLPEKSKDKYKYAFNRFEQWCSENNVKTINEDVLITYFKEKSVNYKSSSLWAVYSMLRSMLSIKKNLDISSYRNLLAFLKNKSIGYQAKRSEIFQREDFEKFLREADDDTYLLMKVVMIIGVVGACTNAELTNLLMENVTDEGNFIRIILSDNKSRTSREFILTSGNITSVNIIEIIRKYINVRADHQRFFVAYRNGRCTKQPVGVHTFGSIPKTIAQFLGLKNPEHYTGHCFRRTSAAFKLLVPQLVHL